MPTYRIIRLFDVTATQRIDIDFQDHDSALAHLREITAHEIAKGSPEDGNLEHAGIEIEDGAEQMNVRYMLDHIESGQLADEIGYFDCPQPHERVEAEAHKLLASLRAVLPYAESRAEDMLEADGELEGCDPGDETRKAVAAVDAAKALLASLYAEG